MVTGDETVTCRAVPLNQPGKADYDRPIRHTDVCVSATEYKRIEAYAETILKKCGASCR